VYTVAVKRELNARHFLTVGDDEQERRPHAHQYRVEIRLEGPDLDEDGYLADICEIEALLDGLLKRYRDKILNFQPAFSGLNPSLEHFARILCRDMRQRISNRGLSAVTVRIWESEGAWAQYRETC